MTNIDQASSVASRVPHFVPGNSVETIDPATLARRFDGKMHSRMSAAKTEQGWKEVLTILVNAHSNSNLRGNVRERFFRECPHALMVTTLRLRTGCPAKRDPNTPSPLGNKSCEKKHDKFARRQRDAAFHQEKARANPPRNDDSNNHRNKGKNGKKK